MGRFVVVEILVFFAPIFLFLLYVRIFHKKKAIEALNLRVLTILIAIGVAGSAIGAMYLSSLTAKTLPVPMCRPQLSMESKSQPILNDNITI